MAGQLSQLAVNHVRLRARASGENGQGVTGSTVAVGRTLVFIRMSGISVTVPFETYLPGIPILRDSATVRSRAQSSIDHVRPFRLHRQCPRGPYRAQDAVRSYLRAAGGSVRSAMENHRQDGDIGRAPPSSRWPCPSGCCGPRPWRRRSGSRSCPCSFHESWAGLTKSSKENEEPKRES
jgi:hypothetical protein